MKLCRGPSVSDICSTWHRGIQCMELTKNHTYSEGSYSQPDTDDFIVSILFSNYWDPTGEDVSHLTSFVEKLPTSSLRKRKGD